MTVTSCPFRALEYTAERKFDLLIFYKDFPSMTAKEMLRTLRVAHTQTPAFLLVDSKQVSKLPDSERRGFVNVVPLPFSAGGLLNALLPTVITILHAEANRALQVQEREILKRDEEDVSRKRKEM